MGTLTKLLAVAFASVALEASAIDYFGYAHTEGLGGQVAAWSNVGHFLVEEPGFDYRGQINHWRVVYGMKSIVELTHVFVSGHSGELLADWEARWEQFVEVNSSRLTPDFVGAFLVMDEPLLRGMTVSEVETLVSVVKETFPNVPTALVENPNVVAQLPDPLPPDLDWIGIDSYGVRDPADDPGYLSQLTELRRKMLPSQRLVVVGDGWFGPVQIAAGLTPCDMAEVAWSYFQLAERSDAVALVFFLWRTDMVRDEAPDAVGSDQFDRCDFCARRPIDTQRAIGALITGKRPMLLGCARRHLNERP
jgi:hypothetical protein